MAEKVMRQLAIWYWNAKTCPKAIYRCCREDKMVQMIQWDLFCMWNAGLWQGWQIHVLHEPQPVSMYESTNNSHDPQPVYESTNNKLLWDFKIQTDNKIEHHKPVLNEIEQSRGAWLLILLVHFTPEWKRKLRTNQDLKRQLKCVWKLCRVTVWFHAVIIGTMEKCYGSCIAFSFFVANSLASLVWYHLYSTAIPPVVLKTNGVNEACSTSNTQLVYWHFFSGLCCLNIWSGSKSL